MLAYLCVSTEGKDASISDKVNILDRFGLSDSEIACVCDANLQSVRNARHATKKKK